MNNANIIGTWRTKDFPLYSFQDGITITLQVPDSKRSTLWILDKEKKPSTLCEGKLNIEHLENDQFQLVFEGQAISEVYLKITCRMHFKKEPESFLINIPNYGERYIEKIN